MEPLWGTAGLLSGVGLFLQKPQFLSYRIFIIRIQDHRYPVLYLVTSSSHDQLNQSVLLIPYHKLQGTVFFLLQSTCINKSQITRYMYFLLQSIVIKNYKVFFITEYCIVTKKESWHLFDIHCRYNIKNKGMSLVCERPFIPTALTSVFCCCCYCQ